MLLDACPDALQLARFQFAFAVGLARYLAVLEGLWLWTGRAKYLDLFRYRPGWWR